MSSKVDAVMICEALTVFICEVREQAAAIRAYTNVGMVSDCGSVFLNRAHDSIWRELLSELARIFDRSVTYGDENCTLLRLREMCLEEQYLPLFPGGEKDHLIQDLDDTIARYNNSPIKKSRNKQLAHHDMKKMFDGKCIEISLDELEKLIDDTTAVFSKIYTRIMLDLFDVTFPSYDTLVGLFEKDLLSITKCYKNEDA